MNGRALTKKGSVKYHKLLKASTDKKMWRAMLAHAMKGNGVKRTKI